jgi:acylpyruvate hydrolase
MKIICVGRNYMEHAKELNNTVPSEPVLFMKPKTALLAPDKPIYYPEFTDELHYECEVVVKILKNGKFIHERFAHKYYNEVTVGIDFTARDVQRNQQQKGLPWEIAKAFDGSAAVGKFVPLTPEHPIIALSFMLLLNGNKVQEGNTADMIFNVDKIIAYTSRYFSLNIGDLIFTGTPAGVGPLTVYDKLEGYLMNQKLLDVAVM